MIRQPDGKMLVGGAFSQVAGVSKNCLFRLNTDGTLDASFNASLLTTNSQGIHSMVLQPDGKMVIAGHFYQVNGVDLNDLARLNADGSLDTSFNVVATPQDSSGVTAVALQPDGRLLFDGLREVINGANVHSLARLNADGSLDQSFNGHIGPSYYGDLINSVQLQPDGKILVGGSFSFVNGGNVNNLVRLNTDGTTDPFFNPGGSGPDSRIYAFTLAPSGQIYVGGNFTSVNGTLRNYVARLNGGGAPDFFNAGTPVGGGFYFEAFPGGAPFGYYNLSGAGYSFPYFFHADLGMEYFFDANDKLGGAYLYDFKSSGFFYTGPNFPWPYLYDFKLNAVLYYYPNPSDPTRYNTRGVRYFFNYATGQVISK